jgi:hypothetical protein
MLFRQCLADRHELHGGEPQTAPLQSPDDVPDESALDSIGLEDDE